VSAGVAEDVVSGEYIEIFCGDLQWSDWAGFVRQAYTSVVSTLSTTSSGESRHDEMPDRCTQAIAASTPDDAVG
jgi:hypothetical protein